MEGKDQTIDELMIQGNDHDLRGDHELALQIYNIVVSKDELFFDGMLNLGIQQFKLNKLDLAANSLKRALNLNPGDPLTLDLLKQLENLLNSPIGRSV